MQYLQPIGNFLSNKIVRWILIISLGLGGTFYSGYRVGYDRGETNRRSLPASSQFQPTLENGMGGGSVDNYGFSPTLSTPIIPNPTATPQTYAVNRGDTIWSIADHLVKNDPRYSGWTTAGLKDEIIRLNPRIKPERMHRGNILYLP